MKNAFSKILTLLLVVVMLFGVSAPTVAYAAEPAEGSSTQGTTGGTGESSEVLGSLTTGWCDVKYTADGIVVTLTPDLDSLKLVDKEMLKELVSVVIEAVKKVVLDDLMADITGDTTLLDLDAGINSENVWTSALSGYVKDKYGADDLDAYVAFITDAIDSDSAVNELATYACDLIKAAVIVGKVSLSDLPTAEEIEPKVADLMETVIDDFISEEVERIVGDYVDHVHANPGAAFDGMTEMDKFVEQYIGEYIEREIERHIDHIINPSPSAEDDFLWSYVDGYLSDKVKEIVNEYIDYLIDPTVGFDEDSIHGYVKDYFNKLINTAKDHYVNPPAEPDSLDILLEGYIDDYVKDYISDRVSAYIAAKKNGTTVDCTTAVDSLVNGEIDKFVKNYVSEAVNAYIALKTGETGGAAGSQVNDAIVAKIDAFISNYFDEQVAAYRAYKLGTSTEKPEMYALIEAKVRERVIAEAVNQGIDRDLAEDKYDNGEFNYAEFDADIDYAAVKDETIANLSAEDYDTALKTVDIDGIIDDVFAGATDEDIQEIVKGIDVDKVISDVQNSVSPAQFEEILDSVKVEEIIKHMGSVKAHAIIDELDFSEVLNESLGRFDEAEKDEFLATVHKTFEDTAERHSLIVEIVEQIGDEELDSILSAIRDDVIAEAHSAAFDDVIKEVLGVDITMAEVDARLPEIAAIVADKYTAMLKSLENMSDGPRKYAELLKYIETVSVDGIDIYTTAGLSVDGAKELLKTIPSFTEISEMDKEEMFLSYSFVVTTTYGECDFSLTAKLGGGYDVVRRLARILADHVEIGIVDGAYTLNVTVPEKLSRALLKLCRTDKISDALKQKIFAAFSKDANDAYALYKDLTFNDIITLLEAIDFEGVLDSEFIKQYVDLSGLSNDEIIAKVREYEGYFNKLMSYGEIIFNKIPERFRDNTIMSLYHGDGNFGYEGTHTVNIEEVLTRISSKYGPLIASYIDRETVTASVDIDITFEKINRVTYVVPNANGTKTTVRDGLLPAGADILFFAGITEHLDKPIVAWVDENGKAVTEMPDSDVVLTAVLDKEFGIITGSGVDKVYDTKPFTVLVTVTGAEGATVTYQWYKDGQPIDKAGSSFEVKDVADSGTYMCVATVVDGVIKKTLTSDDIVINIEKSFIDKSTVSFDYDEENPFTYDRNPHTVGVIGLPEGVTAIVTDNVMTDAGSYTAVITGLNVDESVFDTANYELDPEIIGLSQPWVIKKAEINVGTLEWDYDGAIEYTGSVQTVVLESVPAGVVPTYSGNTGTDIGEFKASVTFALADGYDAKNYEIVGSVTDLTWYITGNVIYLPAEVAWDYTTALKYNGKDQSVALKNLPDTVVAHYEGNTGKAVGSYTATVTFTAVDPEYIVVGSVPALNWNIEKGVIDLSEVEWDYKDPITYTGSEIEIILKNLPDEVAATYSGNKGTDVDNYTATVTLALTEAERDNYELINSTVAPLSWQIIKQQINVGAAEWDYKDSLNYTGSELKVVLKNLPAGVVPNYSGNTGINTGEYTASVTFTLAEGYSAKNYEIIGSVADLTWYITGNVIYLPADVDWNYTAALKYNGNPQSVVLKNLPATIRAIYSDNTATAVGKYTATVTFEAVDSDFIVVGSVPALNWEIEKGVIDLSGIGWDYSTPFTYNGTEFKVILEGLPTQVEATYSGNTGTNAGNYTASATIALTDAEKDNYVLANATVDDLSWSIGKVIVNLADIGWSYSVPFIYNGGEQSVVVTGLPLNYDPAQLIVTYTGNKGTNVGTYTAEVSITSVSDNYDVVGAGVMALEWVIEKADYDMSGVRFEDTTLVYNGLPQGITVKGTLPAGVTVKYSESKVFAGVYTITATFSGDEDNYNPIAPMTATLTITVHVENLHVHKNTAGDVVVEVGSVNGIPADHDFVVSDNSHVYEGFELENGAWGKVLVAYDISFSRGGISQNFKDDFTVKLLIPKALRDKQTLQVIYIKESGEIENIESAREGDYMVFNTEHFSTYAIIEITEPPTDVEPLDLTWLWILLAVLGVGVVVVVIILILRKKRGGDDDGEPTETTEPTVEPEGDTDEPTEETPTEEAPAETPEETPEEAPVETPEETPAEEIPAEETPAEEAPEEAPAETPAEEIPEEVPVETPAEEAPKTVSEPLVFLESAGEDEDGVTKAMIGGEVVLVHFRSSFQSRFIQSDAEIQSYYTQIKNALMSYQGVKARTSWNYESFNRGRVQCAKVNIKGRTLLVYLALNPNEYNAGKYHFTDVSDKPKFDRVPMMMKIRSERALKYTLELIEEMMATLEIEQGAVPTEDYSMPYETTEQLARRGLVKVILPPGMTLDESSNVVKLDVGELIGTSVADDEPAVEPTVDAPTDTAPTEPVDRSLDGEESVATAVVDGETILIRYRRSFQSRLIQAEEKLQSYYTAIKNALLSYKGVKSRTSWKQESFNRGRVQCAKVNIKGRTLMLYLALDPNEYSVGKYHHVDVSDKPKLEKVPMLMKVRSDRGLKYALELIDEVMAKLEIPMSSVATEDYRMPYETTEELVKRGLVKVVLPAGMALDENANIVKVDVGEFISSTTASDEAPNEEAPNEEAPAEEAPAEEAPVEEAPVEETPVEEAPVEEAPVEKAPAEETPTEEIVHVDAVHADELITDEEAEIRIEHIHTGVKHEGKLVSINLDTICEFFEDGDVVDLDALKAKRLVPKNAGRVKVLARGVMTKTLTVIASKFSLQAVKMITLAGGHADLED